jgi:hypothetical protein
MSLVIAPLVLFAAAAFWLSADSPAQAIQSAEPREIIQSPDHWVAFDAVQAQTLDSGRKTAGRFFQGPDGSTRLESGYELDQPLVIDIKNVEQKRQYVKRFDGTWESSPLYPRPDFRPFLVQPGGGLDAERWPAKVKGFDVHRRLMKTKSYNDNGDVREGTITEYLAPMLNFLSVYSESSGGGRSEYTEIKLRPQPKELFAPPPGAVVTELFESSGNF